MRDEHLLAAVFDTPWAILPSKLRAIQAVVLRHAAGVRLAQAQLDALVEAATRRPPAPNGGAVAVLPVMGVISQRMNMMSAFSGGTSTEQLGAAFQQAIADPQVGAVVLEIDSPGGSVFGVQELWDQIYAARGRKPIVAVANSLAASAAYYIASAADEIAVTPSGEVGSIGVIATHVDESQALANEGLSVSFVTAGKYKAEGNSAEPLGDEARAFLQKRVDEYYAMFVNSVAKGRGVSSADVRGGFGQGRVVGARDAKAMGMVDRIETLDQTINRLAGRGQSGRIGATAGEWIEGVSVEGAWDGGDLPDIAADLDFYEERIAALRAAR